jgi:hypothetical protein
VSPTIDEVPGISASLIARLREQTGRCGDDGEHDDDDSEHGDHETAQDFDIDTDSGDASVYTQVTVAEIMKVKAGAKRFNFVQSQLLRMSADFLGDMARQAPRDLSVCLSVWLPEKIATLHQEFIDYFAEEHPDTGASVLTKPNIRSYLRGSGTSAKAGFGTGAKSQSKKRK